MSKKTEVIRVVRFCALDGSQHETYGQAQKHNSTTALSRWLAEYIGENTAHGELLVSAEEMAVAIRGTWNVSVKAKT